MEHLDALFPPAPHALARLRAACLALQRRLQEAARVDGRDAGSYSLAVRMEWEMHTYQAKKVDVSVRTLWTPHPSDAPSAHRRVQRAALFSEIDLANAAVQKEGSTLLRALARGPAWRRLSFLPKMAVEITPHGAHTTFGRTSSHPLDLLLPAAELAARALLAPMPAEADGGLLYTVTWRTSYHSAGPGDTQAHLMAASPTQALALFGALYEHRVFQHGGASHASVLLHTSADAWNGLYGPPNGGWSPEHAPTRGAHFF